MKNILLIAICSIAVLGCDISKYLGKNDNSNTAKPTPSAAPSSSESPKPVETPAKSGVVSTLKKSTGKYPYELKLLENPELRARLQKLLGPDFAAMKANWNVETPIEIQNGILMASGCEQHNCADNMYYLFIDLEKDNINVFHVENGTQNYAEKAKISLPKKFADELGNDQ